MCSYLERSAVKLSLRSFEDSYYYTIYEKNRIPELKSYLQGDRPDQSLLAVKVSRLMGSLYDRITQIWCPSVCLSVPITASSPKWKVVKVSNLVDILFLANVTNEPFSERKIKDQGYGGRKTFRIGDAAIVHNVSD